MQGLVEETAERARLAPETMSQIAQRMTRGQAQLGCLRDSQALQRASLRLYKQRGHSQYVKSGLSFTEFVQDLVENAAESPSGHGDNESDGASERYLNCRQPRTVRLPAFFTSAVKGEPASVQAMRASLQAQLMECRKREAEAQERGWVPSEAPHAVFHYGFTDPQAPSAPAEKHGKKRAASSEPESSALPDRSGAQPGHISAELAPSAAAAGQEADDAPAAVLESRYVAAEQALTSAVAKGQTSSKRSTEASHVAGQAPGSEIAAAGQASGSNCAGAGAAAKQASDSKGARVCGTAHNAIDREHSDHWSGYSKRYGPLTRMPFPQPMRAGAGAAAGQASGSTSAGATAAAPQALGSDMQAASPAAGHASGSASAGAILAAGEAASRRRAGFRAIAAQASTSRSAGAGVAFALSLPKDPEAAARPAQALLEHLLTGCCGEVRLYHGVLIVSHCTRHWLNCASPVFCECDFRALMSPERATPPASAWPASLRGLVTMYAHVAVSS